MKKKLPTIILFSSVIILLLIVVLWPKSEGPVDSDGDGFPDNIDQCVNVPSPVNNGCPEVEVAAPSFQQDKDRDGFNNIELNGEEPDPDDNDPCTPDADCPFCDQDRDGLTNQQELEKGTDPKKKDTDGDGLSDNLDKCPMEFGHADADGCLLTVNGHLFIAGRSINWNTELYNYAEKMTVSIYSYQENRILLEEDILYIANGLYRITQNTIRPGFNYKVRLNIEPKQNRGVRITNIEKTTSF